MDYSMSDYHHNQRPQQTAKRSSTRVSMQVVRANKRHSQYSLLDTNALPAKRSVSQSVHRQSSMADTEGSYDPYRPSRAQIGRTQADHMRVTVLRDSSQPSTRKSSTRVASRVSTVNSSKARSQGRDDVYSLASSPPATRMHSAGTSHLQRLAVSRRISRGSSRITMASRRSAASGSSVVVTHKSASYKRNVSFIHNRRRSTSNRHPPLRSQEHHPPPFTLKERFINDQAQSETKAHEKAHDDDQSLQESAPRSRFSLDESPEPEDRHSSIVRSRKTPAEKSEGLTAKNVRLGSHFFKDDARKVSTEMEKLCDEAFNRMPISSSVATPRTTYTGNRDSSNTYQTCQSSTTSFSVHEDLVPVRVTRPKTQVRLSYEDRPLPDPPTTERYMDSEHLGSYTQRELAKTRDLLKKRAAEADMAPGYLDEIIAHLDRLMQPSAIRLDDEERRAISTPDPSTGIPRKDTFEQILEKSNIGYRSASEPTKNHQSIRDQTVRLVDSPGNFIPISPVKPLTIRKKSQSSTPSAGSPRQIAPKERLITTAELYGHQAEERRSALLENSSLDPIEEDEDKENFDPADRDRNRLLGDQKKRNWFRRRQQDLPPPPLPKDPRVSSDRDPNPDLDARKRKSDVPSQESQSSEAKASGKSRFFKMFSGKRSHKESQKNAGQDYDLDDNTSLATEESTWAHTSAQAYMSGAIPNTSTINVPNRGSRGSKDDNLMPPPPVPRAIQPRPQNWLARFLRIKPAVTVVCFHVSKVRARKEVAAVFREWRKYGMRDIVVDKAAARIWARVDVKNCRCFPFSIVHRLVHSATVPFHHSSANLH